MTRQQFNDRVKQELTVACAVPFDLKVSEINRITDQSARWFYDNFDGAVEDRIYVIPVTAFSTSQFRQYRTLTMPDCVYGITQLKKLREDFVPSFSFDGTTDITAEKVIFKDSANLGYGSESLMYYALNLYWIDLASHLLNHTISFTFNTDSKALFFGGETPNRDVVANCMVELPLEHLMHQDLFFRFVVAKAKIQLSRMIGTFKFPLIGNVEINYELVRDEGKEELAEVKEKIKGDNAMDFFMTTGGG